MISLGTLKCIKYILDIVYGKKMILPTYPPTHLCDLVLGVRQTGLFLASFVVYLFQQV